VVPAGPAGTDAILPVEPPSTCEGAVMATVPLVPTDTVCDAVALQPLPSVTVTEYVVDVEGETVIDCVVSPVDQRYEVPPLAVNVALEPPQTPVGPVMVATGSAFTVTTVGEEVALQLDALPTVTV
jgi:hypothetical protein